MVKQVTPNRRMKEIRLNLAVALREISEIENEPFVNEKKLRRIDNFLKASRQEVKLLLEFRNVEREKMEKAWYG